MRKIFSIFVILLVTVSFNFLNVNKAQAGSLDEIEKNMDLNRDGKINGYDWYMMSLTQKQVLIFSYYISTFHSTVINMSNSARNREVFRVISQLNYFYSGVNTENKRVAVSEIYQLVVE